VGTTAGATGFVDVLQEVARSRATLVIALVVGSLGACGETAPPAPTPEDAGLDDAMPPRPPPPEVVTSLGIVRGARGNGHLRFLGIPYAAPPVGERRWRPPEEAAPWSGVREATVKPSACAQEAAGFVSLGDEDCLYLNVHTPDPMPAAAPVLVWIHGGAFVFGEGLQLDGGTAGDVLAREHGLVVVSMNYRLGAFGFLASDALGTTGNEGFLDQQAALRWVQREIAAFGGDPSRVTIAGESAGGLSVCLHLISPGSRGLFRAAVTQSGLCGAPLPTRAEQLDSAAELATAVGCEAAPDLPNCMRAVSTARIKSAAALSGNLLEVLASGRRNHWPNVDEAVVPGQFLERVAAGQYARVPVIAGWNRDEGTLFVALAERAGTVVDEAEYVRMTDLIAARAGLDGIEVRAAYPLADHADPGAALAAALGHQALACPSRRAALALAGAGSPTRVYYFTYPDAGFQLGSDRPLGAFHSAEIQFVFGRPARLGMRAFEGDELTLHRAMSGYWARFVRSLDPGGEGAVPWPAFDATAERHLRLDRVVAAGEAADRDACAFWERAGVP
jgi:para-nitrobenzyl esterase